MAPWRGAGPRMRGMQKRVPATSTPLPPPVVLTERQRTPCMLAERELAAQQRCQHGSQEATK
jgi:hypothetical protein